MPGPCDSPAVTSLRSTPASLDDRCHGLTPFRTSSRTSWPSVRCHRISTGAHRAHTLDHAAACPGSPAWAAPPRGTDRRRAPSAAAQEAGDPALLRLLEELAAQVVERLLRQLEPLGRDPQ